MGTGTNAVLSLIVLACAIGVGIAGKRLRREDTSMFVMLMLLTLVPSVWISRTWRDGLLCGGIALFFLLIGDSFWDRVGWAAGVAGPLFALSLVVPGGTSVILIFLTLIALWFTGKSSWNHVQRLRRAQKLDSNERSDGEVEIGGTVRRARVSSSLPDVELERAGGWRLFGKAEKFHEPTYLELTTPTGSVLVALDSVALEDVRLELPSAKHENAWRKQLGLEDADKPMLEVVDADEEAYVIGKPAWMRAPEGSGGYRDSPMVPVFGKGSTLYQLPEAEVDARTWWNLILAIAFAIAAGSVGVIQALAGLSTQFRSGT